MTLEVLHGRPLGSARSRLWPPGLFMVGVSKLTYDPVAAAGLDGYCTKHS